MSSDGGDNIVLAGDVEEDDVEGLFSRNSIENDFMTTSNINCQKMGLIGVKMGVIRLTCVNCEGNNVNMC